MSETSDALLRKKTGLTRSWSNTDAFVYAFFSINLVTLGLYTMSQAYAFRGGMIPALIVSAVLILSEIVVYAGLIAVMPRSGGDYVWQSRIFGGGRGFVLAITGWCFILWLWTPVYADMLRQIVLVLFVFDVWHFSSLTLVSTLVIAVTFLGTGIAAVVLPFAKKELYRSSPLALDRISLYTGP